jgi:hypothetical protein
MIGLEDLSSSLSMMGESSASWSSSSSSSSAWLLAIVADTAAAGEIDNVLSAAEPSMTFGDDQALVLAATVALVALVGLVVTTSLSTATESASMPEAMTKGVTTTTTEDDTRVPTKPEEDPPVATSASTSVRDGTEKDAKEEDKLLPTAADLAQDDVVFGICSAEEVADDNNNNNNNDDMQVATAQAKGAMEAFSQEDRGRLRALVGGLLGSLRTARANTRATDLLRQAAEAELTAAGAALLDMEDQYELGQNQLTKTQGVLRVTESELAAAQSKLATTSESLRELEEERQSLRTLGRVAWQLSKERVGRRLPRVTRPFRSPPAEDVDTD